MRNQEIALKLKLSEHTVRNYLLRIFDKLGISSRVELVLYAFTGVEGRATPVGYRADSACDEYHEEGHLAAPLRACGLDGES